MMNPERYSRLERLFQEAREMTVDRRAAFLDEIARDEPELRTELERLLRHDGVPDSASDLIAQGAGARVLAGALDDPQLSTPAEDGAESESPALPRRIGHYAIIRLIAHGGMGAVYEAEQNDPKRRVALKVIRDGFGSAQAAERFRREAQMLGRLRHRGIAQIYDAHTTPSPGAPPYFVMELVQGPTLLKFAELARLDIRQRLELMAEVCDALDHAHQHGLIHRDLKPGNILVEPRSALTGGSGVGDGNGGSSGFAPIEARVGGQPKILDFGVARSADLNTFTEVQPGRLIGTVPYMSPEQATGGDLDARSDVYSVGVIMFELLSGRLPHDLGGKMIHEAARIVRDEEPTPLGSIDRRFRGDVEVIVAKALEKERDRRYASASEVAADIRRFLCDQPIVARPPSSLYRLRKLATRNRPLGVGVAVAAVTLLIAGVVSLAQIRSARTANSEAERQRAVANAEGWRNYVGAIAGAAVAVENHNPATAADFLAAAEQGRSRWEYRHIATRVAVYGPVIEAETPIAAAIFDEGSGLLITASRAGLTEWWDPGTHAVRRTVRLKEAVTGPASFSKTGRYLVAAVGKDSDNVAIFDCDGGDEIARLSGAEVEATQGVVEEKSAAKELAAAGSQLSAGMRARMSARPIAAVAISADGKRVALCAKGGVLWMPSTSESWAWLTNLDINSLTFSNDGRRLVCGYLDARLENLGLISALQALTDHREGSKIIFPMSSILPLESPTGDPPASIGTGDGQTELTLFETGYKNRSFGESTLRMTAIAFDPRTPRIAIATADRLIRVYDGVSRQLLRPLAGPGGDVYVLAFSADGSRLLAASGRVLRIYELDPIDAIKVLEGHGSGFTAAVFDTSSHVLAIGSDGNTRVWDFNTEKRTAIPAAIRDHVSAMSASTAGSLIVAGQDTGLVQLIDDNSREVVRTIDVGAGERVVALAIAADGQRLAARTATSLSAWDAASGTRLWQENLNGIGTPAAADLSPDATLVAATDGTCVRVWDAASGRPLRVLGDGASAFASLAFHSDSRTLAAGSIDGSLHVWDASTGAVIAVRSGHVEAVCSLAFSPDGSRLASGSEDHAIDLWDTTRWQQVLTLTGHGGAVRSLAFSPDGVRLASASDDRTVRVWEAPVADSPATGLASEQRDTGRRSMLVSP